jgi:hypothetical protein
MVKSDIPVDDTRSIVNQCPEPLWDNGSVSSLDDDTASDTEKSRQH